MKAEVVTKARQFSQELKGEPQRFSWSHALHALSSSSAQNGIRGAKGGKVETTLTTRALKKHDHK
ncbi:respiratory burst oxidase-like protein [Sesbania bispinosa]|nr:respiratory burst oxidase-like protein [Sesbania bispinosa]